MEIAKTFTTYDFIVVGIFALFIARGIWLGFVKQITGLVALYLAYLVASRYTGTALPFADKLADNPKISFVLAYLALFCLTYVATMLLGKLFSSAVKVTLVGWFDRIIGALLGGLKALLVAVLMHMLVGAVLPPENPLLRNCQTCSYLQGAVNLCLDLIKDETVRKSFMQQKPAISLETVKQYFTPDNKDRKESSEKK